MLSPGAFLKGIVSRLLPGPTLDGPEAEGYVRALRSRETAVGSMVRKSHLLADEGSYFTVQNAQSGIIEGTNSAFAITHPTMYIANTADPSNPTSKNLYPDYIDLSVVTAGATTTAGQAKIFSLYLVKGNNYTSGGTNLTANITPVNPNSNAASIAKVYFGALTTGDAAATLGITRPIVGYRVYRMSVTASTAPDAVGDRLRIEFGSVENEATGPFGTTAALMANVYQTVMKVPPIVVPPGWSLHLCTWNLVSGGSYSTGVTWLPEAGWWER